MTLSALAEHIDHVPLILYSSDGFGPAEFALSRSATVAQGNPRRATSIRHAGEWSEHDAIRVVDLIARGNARRVYQLS